MTDLWGILAPVLVSVLLSVSAAVAVARFAGPAQSAYVTALNGRLAVVTQERDEAIRRVEKLETRVGALEAESDRKDGEIIDLYRRLNATPPSRAGA